MQERPRMKLHVPSIVLGSLIVAAASLSAGQQGAPNEGRVPPGARPTLERDLGDTRAGAQALTLDLYRPQPVNTPTPVVVWIHGSKGGATTKATSPAVALVTPGGAIARIEYRAGGPTRHRSR